MLQKVEKHHPPTESQNFLDYPPEESQKFSDHPHMEFSKGVHEDILAHNFSNGTALRR